MFLKGGDNMAWLFYPQKKDNDSTHRMVGTKVNKVRREDTDTARDIYWEPGQDFQFDKTPIGNGVVCLETTGGPWFDV